VTNANPAKSRAGQRSPLRVAGNKRARAITGETRGWLYGWKEGGNRWRATGAKGGGGQLGRNGGKKNLVFVTLTYLR